VEGLGQLCGAEQCKLADTAERNGGCELQMLLTGRLADDARELSVEVRSALNVDTERWIRNNTGLHDSDTDQRTKELRADTCGSHSCVITHRWALEQTPYSTTGICLC
jgi:hypothetical protein